MQFLPKFTKKKQLFNENSGMVLEVTLFKIYKEHFHKISSHYL